MIVRLFKHVMHSTAPYRSGRAVVFYFRRAKPVALALIALVAIGSDLNDRHPTRAADVAGGWLSGPALERRLGQEVGVAWSGAPLRPSLKNLSDAHRLAIVLDRRVDPGQELELKLANVTLRQALDAIAEDRRLGVAMLGPVAYFGPKTTTQRLRTVAALRKEEAAKLPAAPRRTFVEPKVWRWEDLATPRELLESLSQAGRIPIEGLERIPHDLWPGADLPPLLLSDRLTLVLAQYDLTFEFQPQGAGIRLVDIPSEVVLQRSYPGGSQPQKLAERYAALLPDSQVTVEKGKVLVRGPLEDHERVSVTGSPSSTQTRIAGPKITKYTLTVREQPLARLLEQLGQQLKLEIRLDGAALEKAGIAPDMLVSFSVQEASLDELLKAVLEPAGLTFRKKDDVIEVLPKGN